MVTLTRADTRWLLAFVKNYASLVKAYPELFRSDEIDEMKVARQLLEEKLSENSNN